MSSLIRKMFQKVLSLDALYKKIESIEKKLSELENISDERESLWLFIEEMRAQEQESYQVLQEELSNVIARSIKPRGEA